MAQAKNTEVLVQAVDILPTSATVVKGMHDKDVILHSSLLGSFPECQLFKRCEVSRVRNYMPFIRVGQFILRKLMFPQGRSKYMPGRLQERVTDSKT